ncbi:MAG TPA: lipopolysaccharide kinase InaA family protein [Rhodocyclaceae bacterium]|nr:lipopolysaccharide kinase InaA family protein [Rhodocyclaceae bacterium]
MPLLNRDALLAAGRTPPLPCEIRLDDGSALHLQRALRILPGQRLVAQARWQERPVLAKLYLDRNGARHAAREAAGQHKLAAAGLPTPALLACKQCVDGTAVLLSTWLEGACTLTELRAAARATPALDDVFELIGRLHADGLVHTDLHPGNLLLHQGRWHLIDGDAIADDATADARADNLALFLAQFTGPDAPSAADALPAYRRGLGPAVKAPDSATLAARVERALETRLKRYIEKTTRDCTRFIAQRSPSRLTLLSRAEADWLAPLLIQPDHWLAQGQRLKSGRSATVVRVAAAGHDCVIKRYNLKTLAHAARRALRPTRAWHAWREAHRLAFLGIPTPAALAVVENRLGPLRGQAWLITAWCEGPSLRELFAGREDQTPDATEAHAMIELFTALHRHRITHGDLKASNLLWHDGRFNLIDLDAATQHSSDASYRKAWARDRSRLLSNWPTDSVLQLWFAQHLPHR